MAKTSIRIRLLVVPVVASALVAGGASGAGAQQAALQRDLRAVLAPGWALQDRNGDEVIDFVRARVVVPRLASGAELAAAANVAARLGYETSAANLGLYASDAEGATGWDAPVVVIGSGNAQLARSGVTRAERVLAPGEGAVEFLPPGPFFREGAVLVEGGDATGLLAAAAYLSGRAPNVWSMRGATWDSVPARFARYLEQRALPADVRLERMAVNAMRPGVARAELTLAVADSVMLFRVAAALESDTATSVAAGAQDSATSRGRLRRADLAIPDVHRVDVRIVAGGRSRVVRLFPARPWETRTGNAYTATASPDFSLGDLYSVGGLYRDTNQDLVPDRTDALLSVHGSAAPAALLDLATRVGLETAGMRFPFADVAGEEDRPQAGGFPIVFGIGHYQTDRLNRDGILHATPAPGEGFIEFVPRAFGGRHGLVIGAADAAGLGAVTDYAARRLPYLWDAGKGNVRLSDLETEVRRFFQTRESAGQIAFAMHKLRTWLDRLDAPVDSIAVELAVKDRTQGLDAYVEALLRERYPSARTTVETHRTGFGVGDTIFTQDVVIPWEVDAFRAVFASEALPKLNASSRGFVEVRVSESPQVRQDLAAEIRAQLASRGVAADAFEIQVLSAYKQGYSWLHDAVLPRLRQRDVGSIEIRYHTLQDSREVRWQQIESPTRWLQELYPIDAVLARELDMPDSLITFVPTQTREPIYTVIVRDPAGAEILRDAFSPHYVVRPFFDLFPEYERIRVTTGWVTVESNGERLVDRRIETDPEAFWRVLQTETYAKIVDYVMDIQDGRPSPGNAPYFDEFRVDLTLSEPNYRIGIDEEVISSTEALHEDIYFETLTLFDLIGGRYGVGGLSYAGRVLPFIQPPVDGKPGHARITFTGKQRGVPRLTLTHRSPDAEPVRTKYDLGPFPVETVRLRGATVRAGARGVTELLFDVTAIDSIDRYAEYRERASEEQIDRTFQPATLLAGMVDELERMQRHGLLQDALSWDRIERLAFRLVPRDSAADWSRTRTLDRTAHPARTTRAPLIDTTWSWNGERIVQWRTPIPPAENDRVLARLATFPGVRVYRVGESFLGQTIYAADFLPAQESEFISQAKLNALKPTLLLSGRQHANEVSSTSHILRLGELLATDTMWGRLLRKVNVVLHPITNPDGARLAYEMQLSNPDFMLHAGYLGALGVDATSGGNSDDPIYPESLVRPELQATWLPDIYMNLHGYPSHEWVQLFAGYAAWVRSRTGTQRTWWAPRGWFIPGFSWIDDARYPEINTAQFAILDSIAAAITSVPDVQAMNERMYARYRKYGKQDIENFREYFHNGILVYSALRGRDATGQGPANPRVTYFSMTTEAPDETARGDWLELVASAGLAHTSALLRYLASGVNQIEHQSNEYDAFVTRSVARKKPVVPAKPDNGR